MNVCVDSSEILYAKNSASRRFNGGTNIVQMSPIAKRGAETLEVVLNGYPT